MSPTIEDLLAENEALRKRAETAEAIIHIWPRTEDGVPLFPGMIVWMVWSKGIIKSYNVDFKLYTGGWWYFPDGPNGKSYWKGWRDSFSTREKAVEASKG